jgi:hypothetical protein
MVVHGERWQWCVPTGPAIAPSSTPRIEVQGVPFMSTSLGLLQSVGIGFVAIVLVAVVAAILSILTSAINDPWGIKVSVVERAKRLRLWGVTKRPKETIRA